MPRLNGKKYPYTPTGFLRASRFAQRVSKRKRDQGKRRATGIRKRLLRKRGVKQWSPKETR